MIARLFFHLRVTMSHFSFNRTQIEPCQLESRKETRLTGVVQMILAFWTKWNTFSSSWSVSPVNSMHLSLSERSNLPLHSLNFSLQRALRGATVIALNATFEFQTKRHKIQIEGRLTINDLEVSLESRIVTASDQKTYDCQLQDDRFARARRSRNNHVLVAVNQLREKPGFNFKDCRKEEKRSLRLRKRSIVRSWNRETRRICFDIAKLSVIKRQFVSETPRQGTRKSK